MHLPAYYDDSDLTKLSRACSSTASTCSRVTPGNHSRKSSTRAPSSIFSKSAFTVFRAFMRLLTLWSWRPRGRASRDTILKNLTPRMIRGDRPFGYSRLCRQSAASRFWTSQAELFPDSSASHWRIKVWYGIDFIVAILRSACIWAGSSLMEMFFNRRVLLPVNICRRTSSSSTNFTAPFSAPEHASALVVLSEVFLHFCPAF